jgi:hypothetical protein
MEDAVTEPIRDTIHALLAPIEAPRTAGHISQLRLRRF